MAVVLTCRFPSHIKIVLTLFPPWQPLTPGMCFSFRVRAEDDVDSEGSSEEEEEGEEVEGGLEDEEEDERGVYSDDSDGGGGVYSDAGSELEEVKFLFPVFFFFLSFKVKVSVALPV